MIRPGLRPEGVCNSILAGLLSAILAVPAVAQSNAPGSETKTSRLPAGMTVSPLRVELASQERSQTLVVNNGLDQPLAVQGRIFAWSQFNGEDVYTPSSDHVVTPSIMMIAPGESQIIRVLRKAPASSGEKTYRLVLDQLPDGAASDTTGTQSRMRFVLPFFVDRDKSAPTKLTWRVDGSGLRIANEGGSTARVVNVVVKRANGEVVAIKDSDLRYVLGSSSISFPLTNGCQMGKLKVTAVVDGEPVDVEPVSACG